MLETEWFSGRAVEGEEARAERHELRKIFGILAVVGVLVGIFLGLGGCAAVKLPPCPVAQAHLIHDAEGRPYAAFDEENLKILQRSYELSARGECVDQPDGGET